MQTQKNPERKAVSAGATVVKTPDVRKLLLLRDVTIKTEHRRERNSDLARLLGELKQELSPVGRLQELIVEEMAAILFALPRWEKRQHGLHEEQTEKTGQELDSSIAEHDRRRKALERTLEIAGETLAKFERYAEKKWIETPEGQMRKDVMDLITNFNQMLRRTSTKRNEMYFHEEPTYDLFGTGCRWDPKHPLRLEAEKAAELDTEALGNVVLKICQAAAEHYRKELEDLENRHKSRVNTLEYELELKRYPWEDDADPTREYEEATYQRLEELQSELDLRQALRARSHPTEK